MISEKQNWKSLTSAYNLYAQAGYLRGQLAILPSLVETSFINGKEEKANLYYKEIKTLSRKLNDDFYLGYTNIILGNEKLKKNEPTAAIKYFNSALETYKKYNNEQGIALIYERLGEAFESVGSFEISRENFELARQLNAENKDKFNESKTLFNLAKLHLRKNNLSEAADLIKQSVEITENLYFDIAHSNLSRSYLSGVYERYGLYINLLMNYKEESNRNFSLEALRVNEKSRSRFLLENIKLAKADFTKDADPVLLEKEKEIHLLYNFKVDELSNLLSTNANNPEIKKLTTEISLLENQLEEIKAVLKENSPIYSAIKNPEPFDLENFQQNIIDEDSVLLEFSLGEKESYLWLISKNEFSSVTLPSRKILESHIERIHEIFESRQPLPNEDVADYQKRTADNESIYNQEISSLSRDILGKITESIANKRLLIVPDGKIAMLPFAALIHPQTNEILIKHNEIIFQPSAAFLSFSSTFETTRPLPEKDLLVFADPVFSEDDSRLETQNTEKAFFPNILNLNFRDFRLMDENGKIPRLFASLQEAESIAKIVNTSQTEIISGFEVNREKILSSDISQYKIVHFTTHGLVDVKRPEVSGIVLSQYDVNGNKQDGFLRLQDIYSLNLQTGLVALSSCQSGVGKEIKGEGLMSINNAFLQAGAESVLSSYWKVDDYATAELMKIFYRELMENNLPPSQALRQAQIQMSSHPQFSSPFYWAAFTVHGEFRHPIAVNYQNSIPITVSFALIIGLSLIIIMLFRRRDSREIKQR